jgi:hypothetical protein
VLGIRERPCLHRPCWNQRMAMPVPLVQGTREPAGLL